LEAYAAMTRHTMHDRFSCNGAGRSRVSFSRLDILPGGIFIGILLLIVGLLIGLQGGSGG